MLFRSNGYASGTYQLSGGGTLTLEMSPDSNTWSTATATNTAVYLRLSVTVLPMETVSISNIAIYSWLHPSLWHARPDLQGQIVLTDTPTEARQLANKTYVDASSAAAAIAGASAWSSYPATGPVDLGTNEIRFADSYTLLAAAPCSALSYAPISLSSTQGVFSLQYAGTDILTITPSNTLLSITNFWLDASNHFNASVWTGGVVSAPSIQYTTNLLNQRWINVSLTSNSYPTATDGSYHLRWTNLWSTGYFRASCAATNAGLITFAFGLNVTGPGGNVPTNTVAGPQGPQGPQGPTGTVDYSVLSTASVAYATSAGTASNAPLSGLTGTAGSDDFTNAVRAAQNAGGSGTSTSDVQAIISDWSTTGGAVRVATNLYVGGTQTNIASSTTAFVVKAPDSTTNTLIINTVNRRLGMGTNAPSTLIDLSGAPPGYEGYSIFRVNDYGSVAAGQTCVVEATFPGFAGGIACQAYRYSFAYGHHCTAMGQRATAFGSYSTAGGYASFACGEQAHADSDNTFVFSDGLTKTASQTKEFMVHARGGIKLLGGNVGISTTNPATQFDCYGTATIRTNLVVHEAFYIKTNTVVTAPASGFGGMYVDAATNYWFWHATGVWTNKLW